MDSTLEKTKHSNKPTTLGSSESMSPILVSKMIKKKRKKCLNKNNSPENGGFCKKKVKVFKEKSANFLSASGCSRDTTNNRCVRRNLNTFFSDLKEQQFLMKMKNESIPEHLPQHENKDLQSHKVVNSVSGIYSYKNCWKKEERHEKIQKSRNFENHICKSNLSGVSTSPVHKKSKDNTFVDVTGNCSIETSWKYIEHSPLMEFESPVRCSVKSNSDNNRSPLWFDEFDLGDHNNQNNSAEVCTSVAKKCIWNDITTKTIDKIEEYNTQQLIEQNKFQKNLSPVFIDFETSPVTSKPDSFKISLEKSKDSKNEDFSSRIINVIEHSCSDKTNVTCFETVRHSRKQHEPVIIEECSSPPIRKRDVSKFSLIDFNAPCDINKDPPLVHINTDKTYYRIEDCSQESYLEGSCTSPQYTNKNNYNVGYDIEFDHTHSESRTSSCGDANINSHLLPGVNKNMQVSLKLITYLSYKLK